MKTVLIAYSTKTGTTKHAAEIISGIFNSNGFNVDVKNISDIDSISSYHGIIIGAPINGMMWHPDASKFVERHKNDLKGKPVAYFFMSYLIGVGRSFFNNRIKNSLNKASKIAKPLCIGMFKGKGEGELPAPARFIFGIKGAIPLDRTDDKAVTQWAIGCVKLFMQELM
jgi:menaquinone-dependent protoporphyrinogen IX oxidase